MFDATLARTRAAHLSADQLFARHLRLQDPDARDELIVRYMPLARKLALRYSYTDEPVEDLVQVACVGLLGAIDRFEPALGNRFATFAAPTILGELKRHFRDKGWVVHVPRDLQERALAVSRTAGRLSHELGHSPTIIEIGEALGYSVQSVLEAIEAAHGYAPTSLDAPVPGEEDFVPRLELLGREDDRLELAESRQEIAVTWRALSQLEREVVALRFLGGLTQREIGARVGYSQTHVSRLVRRAVKRLVSASGETDVTTARKAGSPTQAK